MDEISGCKNIDGFQRPNISQEIVIEFSETFDKDKDIDNNGIFDKIVFVIRKGLTARLDVV